MDTSAKRDRLSPFKVPPVFRSVYERQLPTIPATIYPDGAD